MNAQPFVIRLSGERWAEMKNQLLQGPREPKEVRRDGYGFTTKLEAAWPFETKPQAEAKVHVLARHFSMAPEEFEVISPLSPPLP